MKKKDYIQMNLPIEILINIFNHISIEKFHEILVLNHDFHKLLIPIYYSTLQLTQFDQMNPSLITQYTRKLVCTFKTDENWNSRFLTNFNFLPYLDNITQLTLIGVQLTYQDYFSIIRSKGLKTVIHVNLSYSNLKDKSLIPNVFDFNNLSFVEIAPNTFLI
jgi:hypothetical protein